MSSTTPLNSIELSTSHQTVSTSKVIIENHSNDLTISKCDQSSPPQPVAFGNNIAPVKTQVLPLVYIQNKNQVHVPFATNAFNRTPSNNFLSQIQFSSAPVQKTVTSGSMQNGQNIIITPARTQPLVLPKPPNIATIVGPTGAKLTGAYVTMLKPVPKPDFPATIPTSQANLSENMIVSKNGFLQSVNTKPQKIVLQSMHKILPRGPSVTATTNSVQPKFTVVSMPTKPDLDTTKPMYNFQISDGKLHRTDVPMKSIIINNANRQWTKLDPSTLPQNNIPTIDITKEKDEEKGDVSNKVYELSITEESISNQSHPKTEVTSGENSNSSSIDGKKDSKSHEVSILKKTFNFPEKSLPEAENLNHKEVITNPNSSENIENTVITIPQVSNVAGPKPERRRKPKFSFRKDESDISFVGTVDKKEDVKPDEFELKQENEYDFMEVAQIKGLFEVDNDDEIKKMLRWEGEIGTLPETNLKFIYNEFGILEYLTEEDYRKIQEKRHKKVLEKIKYDPDKEVRCLECGCYGLQSDFTTLDYCSLACQDVAIEKKNNLPPEVKQQKKRKQKLSITKTKSDTNILLETKKEELASDRSDHDDEKSNDSSSKEKFAYPWACKKKGFSWPKYLDHMKAKGAPVKLFKDPFPYNKNGFRVGMKLEGVDPQHPSYFCVLTVVQVVGYRIRLHFDGYSANYDIWCNADSMDIFPPGWCEKYEHVLHPPRGYTEEDFNWIQYLKDTKCIAAPKHLFANRPGQAICPNGFRIGMKLEAVDKKNNTSLICVATVRDMMDNRILVHFDGWDDIYDYWADPTSPYIHPVGWCDQYGHNLTPPSDYPTPETFSWETYLKEQKATAAPVRAFKQRPACGFRRDMRLECVDKRVPHLIRVTTVDDVKEHQIRVRFDGWPDRYSYWVDDDSPDIHPVGWCQKTGHPIEPPLTPDDVYDFLECPTVGCRGQGHIKGPKYPTHNCRKYCPYADENIDNDRVLPDRLLSPNRNPEAIVPVSREPRDCKIKPKLGRPPKLKQEPSKDEESSVEKRLRTKRKYTKRKLLLSESESEYECSQESNEKKSKIEIKVEDVKQEETGLEEKIAEDFIEMSKICPAERESWRQHSQFLDAYILSDDNPFKWTVNEVIDFVSLIPGCENRNRIFKQEKIDGESFLHLSQKDILSFLNLKVGPAIKLYNSIVLLREKFQTKKGQIFTKVVS